MQALDRATCPCCSNRDSYFVFGWPNPDVIARCGCCGFRRHAPNDGRPDSGGFGVYFLSSAQGRPLRLDEGQFPRELTLDEKQRWARACAMEAGLIAVSVTHFDLDAGRWRPVLLDGTVQIAGEGRAMP